jgi:formate hydrogenlyase transcriptional activator
MEAGSVSAATHPMRAPHRGHFSASARNTRASAFTGALRRKLGKVELAAEGTLFLDEIGDLPLESQTKPLRLLEEGTFERVGGTEELRAAVRLVTATNRDLEGMVDAGQFRADLFYRLQVVPVMLPPLHQRREDIRVLALFFLQRAAAHLGRPSPRLSTEAISVLEGYAWPGNVRELEHVIMRAVIACREPILGTEYLTLGRGAADGPVLPQETLSEHERRYLLEVLEHTGWIIRGPRGAAQWLGLHESTLRSRMRKLGIQRPGA